MSTEIIVDREELINNVNETAEFMEYIEQGYECKLKSDSIEIQNADGKVVQSYNYINLEEIQEKYSDTTIYTTKINGVTWVTAGDQLVDCGFVKDTELSILNSVVNMAASEEMDLAVKIYDEASEKNLNGVISKVTSVMSVFTQTAVAFEGHGVDYDAVVDMGCAQLGILKDDVAVLYTDIIMRTHLKFMLDTSYVELEAGFPVTIQTVNTEEEVIVKWDDGEINPSRDKLNMNSIYSTSEQEITLAIYKYLTEHLSEEQIEELEIANNVDIDGDGVIEAQGMTVLRDPLILDLNGNGIMTTTVENGTYFDFKEDGFKEKTAWADNGDGILVYDINGNGTIDNAGELFGDRTLLANGTYARNGYEAIKQYDTDKNGQINADDEIFNKLMIWMDADNDGITDKGELKSLTDLQVQSIGIAYTQTSITDANGNTILGQTDVTLTDGSKMSMAAFNLQNQTTDTILKTEIDVPDYIKYTMPDLCGSGNMLSLHQAMTNNTELYDLVKQYMTSYDSLEKYQLAEKILISWADCGDETKGSRGQYIDATHMAVIEKFFGSEYEGLGGHNPNNAAGPALENIYQDLVSQTRKALLLNTSGLSCMLDIKLSIAKQTDNKSIDLLPTMEYLDTVYTDNPVLKYEILQTIIHNLLTEGITYEELENEKVEEKFREYDFDGIEEFAAYKFYYIQAAGTTYGTTENEIIVGDKNHNIINGQNGNDIIYGGEGDDILDGSYGENHLYGGDGNDTFTGIYGSDTYHFEAGDGQDIIETFTMHSSWDRTDDKIVFGESVKKSDIHAKKNGYDLILENKTTGDSITIENAYNYSNGRWQIKNICFANGDVLTEEDIKESIRANGVHGTDGDDSIGGINSCYGYHENETMYGYQGNDTLHGENGDDILYGGEGNDMLGGGYGNDHLYGGEGDDTLDGSYGENHLYGGAGNDTFTGIYGSETYHFEAGDGQDIIETFTMHSSWDRTDDKIVFGESVKKSDIHAKKKGYDLILENTVTGDTITIKNAYNYSNGRWQIKDISFENGDVLTEEDIKTMIMENGVHGTDGDDSIGGINSCYGYHEDETMYGYQGNDRLNGENGDDILYGGEGNDTLNGGYGNDHLYGGEGDDTLDGSYGENHLYGGAGNDTFTGIYGSDTYHFEAGDGQDIIETFTMHSSWDRIDDKIVFGESVKKSDIHAKKNGYDLILENTVTGDTITIKNAYNYSNGRWQIKDISFENGDVLTEEDIKIMIMENGVHGTDGDDSIGGINACYGYHENETMYGYQGNDRLNGENGDDILYGGEGNDTLGGGYGNDHLYGGEGADTLDGGYGANHLYGGKGNDILTGLYGDDTYHFEAGDGQDIIQMNTTNSIYNHNTDRIVFGESVKKEDITARRENNNLILENKVIGDTITIEKAYNFSNGQWNIKDISFANGEVLTEEDIKSMIRANGIHGTDDNDTIYGISANYAYTNNEILHGHGGNDSLYGQDGDDILYGGEGDDTLDGGYGANHLYGGKGNDILTGLYGDDTYHFEAGDGQDIIQMNTTNSIYNHNTDRIVFGESVKKEDITARRENNNLILENKVTGDTITIEKAYNFGNGQWTIKDISFANGDVLTEEDIKELIRANGIHGTDGNDTICGLTDMYGYSANEIIDGGAGNDTLYGDSGDDIYIFEQGDGQDKISDRYGNNTISFGEGITADNLLITTQNYNVAINFNDSEDMITLMDALRNDAYTNFELTFMDGMIGAIDLSSEADNKLYVIREAETQAETVTDMVATELPSEVQTDTQVLQMVDVMNTGSGENVSAVETTEPFNTVEETLLFVEQ